MPRSRVGARKLRTQPVTCRSVRGRSPGMIRSWRRVWVRPAARPATRRPGSAVLCRSRVWAEASRSTAVMAAVSHASLIAKERLGDVPGRCRGRCGCGPRPGRERGGGRRARSAARCECWSRSGVAVAAGLFDQVELGARVRAFPAHDHHLIAGAGTLVKPGRKTQPPRSWRSSAANATGSVMNPP